jgi:predicted ATP-grasp superfamily ATP-dependent carboligase
VALVLDCGFVNGLEAIRSLAEAGVGVLAVDHRERPLGFRSRFGVKLAVPDPAEDERAYVAALAAGAARHGVADGVLFPTHDAPLLAVARHAAALPGLRLPGSGIDVLEPLLRKRHQLEVADAAGIGVPRTWHPRDEQQLELAAAAVPYPAIVKPSTGVEFKRRLRRPVLVCHDADELRWAYRQAAGDEPMVQEVVPGGDSSLWTVGTYTDRDGRALGVFCGRKLLQMPRSFGTCRLGEARWRDDAVEAALGLLRALGYHGIAQTEFRLDARDGRLKLMEVNPRLWQWHGLARACGVDLPWIAYADAAGRPPAPVRSGPAHDGRRWVVAAAHLRHARLEGMGVRETLAPLRPPVVEGTWDRRDPLPAAVAAAGLVLAPMRRLRRRVGRR